MTYYVLMGVQAAIPTAAIPTKCFWKGATNTNFNPNPYSNPNPSPSANPNPYGTRN